MWGRSMYQFVTVLVPVNATPAQVVTPINVKTGKVGDVCTTRKVGTVRIGGTQVVAWEFGRGATTKQAWGAKKNIAQTFLARS